MSVYSIHNVLSKKFSTVALHGGWADAIGEPELSGTWFIYGAPKNGKTSFAMQLAKELSGFRRVLYNSIEEGMSLSIKKAVERAGLAAGGSRVVLSCMDFQQLKDKLRADIVIIDSIQFMELQFAEYKQMKALYPRKLFIYISHVSGNLPDGQVARRIWRDSSVVFRVEGFKAFTISRYGGEGTITIDKERAYKYWGE
jgi:hypothetical protein